MGRTASDSEREQSLTPVPPTTNELDAKTRARLLRQAQKLSKVFGEVPTLDPESSVGSIRRSPSLAVDESTRRRHTDRATYSPRHTDTSTIRSYADDDLSIISSRRHLSVDERIAKLNRMLGETVPSELVFPSKTADILPPKRKRRRKSLDPTTFVPPPSSPQPQVLKRSRSMTTRKAQRESWELQNRYQQNFGPDGLLSDKQRALNVKRARKMVQVFGHQPPNDILMDLACQAPLRPPSPVLSLASTLDLNLSSARMSRHRTRSAASIKSNSDPEENHSRTRLKSFAANTNFQARRRRVAKLTRFFGVDYQDISLSIPAEDSIVPALFSESEMASPTAVQVEIHLGGRRLWRFMDSEAELNPDINLVLDKLRALRAT